MSPQPETDGPVGTALLAAALAACGVPARVAVDTPSAAAVRAALVEAAGVAVALDEVAVEAPMPASLAWPMTGAAPE